MTIAMTLLTCKRIRFNWKEWTPAIISGVFTAVITFYGIYLGEGVAAKETYYNHRIEHAEKMAANFAEYTAIIDQIIMQCRKRDSDAEKFKGLLTNSTNSVDRKKLESDANQLYSKQEDRIEDLAHDRSKIRIQLLGSIDALSLYIDANLKRQLTKFREWDELQRPKTCKDLPSISEWRQHEAVIIGEVQQAVLP